MLKFKCNQEKCEHVADVKGFCPKDGAELVEVKSEAGGEDRLASILEKIGDVVENRTKETLKAHGLDGANRKDIFEGKKILSGSDKIKYAENMLLKGEGVGYDADRATYDSLFTEKEKEEYLRKARSAYFFKNLVAFASTRDPEYLTHVKALAEGVDADGGYTVPTEFRAELVRDLREESFLRNWVRVIPVIRDTGELPTQLTNVTVSWGSENTAISTTTVAFGQLTWNIQRLNTMIYTSRELVADSAIGILDLIRELFVEAIGIEEDRVIVAGSGSGQPKGILQETLAGIDNANVDANIADNIKKLPYRLKSRYRTRARWLANPLALEQVAILKDNNNQYLLKTLEEGEVSRLAGKEIRESGDMPVDTLLLGDFGQYYLFDRQRISVETTSEGAGTFEKHQVAIKVIERIDGKVAITNAFRKITNCGFD